MGKKVTTKPRRRAGPAKFPQVSERIRSDIERGRFPRGSRLPAVTELAEQFHVNKATICRAIGELVQEGLVVSRRGSGCYVADRKRQPLIPGRHLRLGILWRDKAVVASQLSMYYGKMTMGALAAWGMEDVEPEWSPGEGRQATRITWNASDRGLTVVCLGESRSQRPRRPPLKDVKAEDFDGVLTVSIIDEEWLDQLHALSIPLVMMDALNDRFNRRSDQVFVDPNCGYRDAVKHFVAQGMTRIHFVMGMMAIPAPEHLTTEKEIAAYRGTQKQVDPDSYLRFSAYRQAMDECGLRVQDDWVHYHNFSEESTEEFGARLASLPEDQRPEAVICHDTSRASVIAKAFGERGLLLHGAGSACGESPGPALPIRVHAEEMGMAAGELLVSRILRPDRLPMRVGVPMAFEAAGTGVEQSRPRVTAAQR